MWLFCQTLKEYMLFVERVRLHAKTMTVGAAVHRAVTECIREGILSDFLSQNRVEVIAVSIFEYDEERELALMRKAIASEARKEGIAEGHAEGHAAGRTEGSLKFILFIPSGIQKIVFPFLKILSAFKFCSFSIV